MVVFVGPGLLLLGLVRIAIAAFVSVVLVYLLLKLAKLVDVIAKAKQTSYSSADSKS